MSLGVTNSRTSFLKCNPFRGGATELACFSCTNVLPRDSFANPQTKMERGRYGTAEEQAHRFCVLCGMNKGKYNPGDLVVQGENVRFICHHCKILRDGRFCKLCAICSHCDRRGVLLERCKGAENHEGHEVIGKTLGSELLVLINSIFALLSFRGNRHRSDDYGYGGYNDYHGDHYDSDGRRVSREWSPEWYDGSNGI